MLAWLNLQHGQRLVEIDALALLSEAVLYEPLGARFRNQQLTIAKIDEMKDCPRRLLRYYELSVARHLIHRANNDTRIRWSPCGPHPICWVRW